MMQDPASAPSDATPGGLAATSARPLISCGILGALAALPFAAMLLWSWYGQPLRTTSALMLTTLLLAAALGACARTWRRFFLIAFPLWVIASSYAAYTVLVGKPPGLEVALLICGASWEEIAGLFQLWEGKWMVLPIVGLLALYLLLSARLPLRPVLSGTTVAVGRVLLVLSLPLVVFAVQNGPQLSAGVALNPVIGGTLFFGREMRTAREQLHGKLVDKTPFHARRADDSEEVHVLIVGESARRASWSAYGYDRRTTPYLDRLKSDGEAVFLRDAMADANLTTFAVPIMLTGLTPQQATPGRRLGGNLLDLAKEAGYTTAWLVNQDVGVTTSMAIAADHLDYPPDLHQGLFSRRTLDDVLLPALRREISRTGRPRLIGMHVMGSHWEYYLRYPKSFQRFGSAQRLSMLTSATTDQSMFSDLVDAYDNSVLYTDWFLQQVIEACRVLRVPATVTFFPDHGEASPYLDGGAAGHGAPRYVPAEFEIPAFVWLNAAYRSAHPEKVAALEANADREIRTHDVFYTVADLMGITWPAFSPERSFVSPQFVPDASRQHLARGVLTVRP